MNTSTTKIRHIYISPRPCFLAERACWVRAFTSMPGYKKRNRLRMSPILHPTDFADFSSIVQNSVLSRYRSPAIITLNETTMSLWLNWSFPLALTLKRAPDFLLFLCIQSLWTHEAEARESTISWVKLTIPSRKSNGSACSFVVQFNDGRNDGLKIGGGFQNTGNKVIFT